MKYLEYPGMDNINSALNFETPECIVYGRVEPYSCKAAGADKKLYKQLENKYPSVGAMSPPDDDAFNIRNIVSPFGPMDQSASRKTLFYLIGILNASFPDYDFSDVKPEQFRKEPSVSIVVNSINSTLLNLGNERAVKEMGLWDAINQLIELEDSDVYSYNPESDSDPNDEEGGTFLGLKSEGDDDDDDMYNTDDDEEHSGFGHRRKRNDYEDEFFAGDMDLQ
ncbi:RNA polymerase III-inhibiting protein maf1 [Entomortierella lignicola]|nr:RNA polymerase III-inhibiting protein maf1 [Entomortierella lignicola]